MVKSELPIRAGGRIIALDGIRGLCALAVACFHIADNKLPLHGYIAVDMFFLMSGFVVAGAYEERLAQGMSLTRFFLTRMGRLYPVYLFGMAFGALLMTRAFADDTGIKGFAAAIFFLPAPVPGLHWMYNLNVPMWSLVLEVIANVLFAGLGFRFGNRVLLAIAAVSGVIMIGLALLTLHLTMGSDTTPYDFVGGLSRIMFSFPLGVVIYRWRRDDRLPLATMGQKALVACTVVPMFAFVQNPWIDIVCVVVVFPCVLMSILMTPQTTGRIADVYEWLGRYSYPLYATHLTLNAWLAFDLQSKSPLMVPVTLILCYGMAVAVHIGVELPGKKLFDRFLPTKELTGGIRTAT